MHTVPKMTAQEVLAKFQPTVHKSIRNLRQRPGVTGLGYLVCHVLDSSRLGQRSVVCYGPDYTYKSLDDLLAQRGGLYITGLPSSAAFCEGYTTDPMPD